MKNTNAKHIKWSHIGICLIAVIAFILIFWRPLYTQLYSWNLTPKPEPYTELYFASTPPKSFLPEQLQTVSFTLHNVEYQTTSYTYTVDQLDGNGVLIARLAKGTISLAQDDKTIVNVPVTFVDNDATAQVRVTITFLEKNRHSPTTESIYYLVKRGES